MIKPILFNGQMVRAILDGRKTVTRRVVKLPRCGYFEHEPPLGVIPPYQPDDILYVRETWWQTPWDGKYHYLADSGSPEIEDITKKQLLKECRCRPSIHMPKEIARIWLRVTDVRVERLQEINEGEAKKEGLFNDIDLIGGSGKSAARHFADLWDTTIKKSDLDCYGWAANPWAWVIEFERCEKPEEV